ncbi:MAG: LytR C-terminal domain-containing protein [Candidatus Eisenbacteria sp.]|nr:LytR C-terminal domain-containing protein [Candidatus Eisenbacteria bacterium]
MGRIVRWAVGSILVIILLLFLASVFGFLDYPRTVEHGPGTMVFISSSLPLGGADCPDRSDIAQGCLPSVEMIDAKHKPIRVHLANGCGVNRLAASMRAPLQRAGFDVCGLGDADRFDYCETLIVDRAGGGEEARAVCAYFQERWHVGRVLLQARLTPEADVLIVLGRDLADLVESGNSPSR